MNAKLQRLVTGGLRIVSLVLLAAIVTTALVRLAPGYFSDERELDPRYAGAGRRDVAVEQQTSASLPRLIASQLQQELSGNLGISRHYAIPVADLLRSRAVVSGRLIGESVFCGWAFALACAAILSGRRSTRGESLIALPTALLLAFPVGALATFCLTADFGGPLLVLSSLIAVRDFKLLYRLLRRTWGGPQFLYARALGLPGWRIAWAHLAPALAAELVALMMTSVVVALSLAVPVEVIFDVPGLGQLAWTAALNRDLPVLLAVTLLLALCVGVAAAFTAPGRTVEVSS